MNKTFTFTEEPSAIDIYCHGDPVNIPQSVWISREEYLAKIDKNPHFDFCAYAQVDEFNSETICSRFAINVCRSEVGIDKHKFRCKECPPYYEEPEKKSYTIDSMSVTSVWLDSNIFVRQITEDFTHDYCAYSPPMGSNKTKFCFLIATATNREQVGSDIAKYRCEHCKEKVGAEEELLTALVETKFIAHRRRALTACDTAKEPTEKFRRSTS